MDPERHQEIARCLFRESNDALLLFDPREHRVVDANPTALRLTGIDRPRLLQLRVWDLFTSDEPDGVERLSLAYRRTGWFHSREGYYLQCEANAPIPVNISVSRIHTRPDPLGLVVARDISERVRAAATLRASEERHRTLVESAGVLIWSLSSEGTITSLNPAFDVITGWSRSDWVGQPFVTLVHPGDATRAAELFDRALAGESLPMFELRLRARDGADRRLELLSTRRLVTREQSDVLAIARDVTEVRRAEEAIRLAESLRRAKEDAETANQAKDHLMSMVSHELRTPLNPVLAIVSALQEEAKLPPEPELREYLEIIRRNIEQEARLVDDLLSLTRLGRGKFVLHQEVVDLHPLLRMVIRQFQARMNEKGIDLQMSLCAQPPLVWADPGRLQQVFSNILDNAVKFTDKGGQVRVRSCVSPEGRVRVEVSDTGIGIAPDMIPRLFRPFEQGDQTVTRKFGGLGLGLVIARGIVDLHGGSLSATSEGLARGSVFTIEIDALPTASTDPDSLIAARAAEAAPGAAKARRILLVEDHVDTLRIVSQLFKGQGYEVLTAVTVRSALETIERKDFDLLVCDIGLPDGSGLDIMRKVSRLEGKPGIALSGFGDEADIRRSKEAGFARHLVKPVLFQHLEEVVSELIG